MNAILNHDPGSSGPDDIAQRIARRTLSKRGADYAGEVRRLLDAGIEVMRRCGTTSRPWVSDIVEAAGLSNEAFYRHFPSKDALVAAILEDGAQRLRSYLLHQMAKEKSPEDQVRRWVTGVLSQAEGDVAATTRSVTWNAGSIGEGFSSGRHFATGPLAELLEGPFKALGTKAPALDSTLATHATVGLLSDHLWERTTPTRQEVERVTDFCVRVGSASARNTDATVNGRRTKGAGPARSIRPTRRTSP